MEATMGKEGRQIFAQLKSEMADLKAEVERQSKNRKKGGTKKCFVMMDDSSDSD